MKKGISLIVLIVTIIVMIIIAGAVIISLTETNIIDQAETAVEKHNMSELNAAASMAYSNWLANKHLNNVDVPVQNYIRNELVKQNVLSWDETSKYYITPTGGIEEVDQDEFVYLVNIPEGNTGRKSDIEVDIDINKDINSKVTIEWGDSEITETGFYSNGHLYQKPGIYEIKIKGAAYSIDLNGQSYFSGERVIAIKSFGNLGLEYICLWDTPNLKYIASPNAESFKNLKYIYFTKSGIQEVPEYFFKNCNNLEVVDFEKCTNLTSIPSNIFDGISQEKVSNIEKIFPEGVEVPSNW